MASCDAAVSVPVLSHLRAFLGGDQQDVLLRMSFLTEVC